ncbi:hypothetical protein [Sphingomonas beigongshangi]|uniref:hypothetical protein n=1 Tax=Sphingomonas beigongshangi TaxID=2782540 RepID=UPI00193B5A15|nr:hypothetical protein [Sphingomonas beigongshangi]
MHSLNIAKLHNYGASVEKRPLLKRLLWMGGRWGTYLLPIVLAIGFIELRVPAALAFPYNQKIGNTIIYAEEPIRPSIGPILDRADKLLGRSTIDIPNVSRQVVLTSGGWRWQLLALNMRGVVALRRPFSNVLIFNRSDIAADRVTNGAALGGTRTLSGTIAHETTHMLVARHFGEWRALLLPSWKQEGYADYIAQETSVDPRDEGRIRAIDAHAGVLVYYEGRRRVAAELTRNGGSVDALMAP